MTHAAAHRLGQRLLGGEALRQKRAGSVYAPEFRQLALAQHPFGGALAVTRPQCLDAGVFDDVGADAEDHA